MVNTQDIINEMARLGEKWTDAMSSAQTHGKRFELTMQRLATMDWTPSMEHYKRLLDMVEEVMDVVAVVCDDAVTIGNLAQEQCQEEIRLLSLLDDK